MMEAGNLSTPLAQFLEKHPTDTSFPDHSVNYFERFKRINEYLNKEIHVHVNQAATAKIQVVANPEDEQTKTPVVTWLTDHGPEHIATVLRRASVLSCHPSPLLTAYEAYLLLVAIHFHDVGNVFGRDEHERKITKVMSQLGPELLGDNSLEKRMIRDIAMVHGGDIDGDRDTLSHLRYERFPKPGEPRVHFLAALLRFSDELAEDRTRTSRFLIGNELITAASEAYHIYADRLHRIDIRPEDRVVALHFELNAHTGMRTWQKENEQVYLFDEIQGRLLKMHKELIYCGRFLRPYVHIEAIDVRILICSDDYYDVLKTISFSVRESGYPGSPRTLAEICPELKGCTGSTLQQEIENLTHPSS